MHLHVVPVGDLIEHDTEHQEGCVCGPDVELNETRAGDGWIYVHHSLDQRELSEK
jgi:hypothetical protein